MRTLSEIKQEQKRLNDELSDLTVKINLLNEERPINGIYVNWIDDEYEFEYRGTVKKLKEIVEFVIKHEDRYK